MQQPKSEVRTPAAGVVAMIRRATSALLLFVSITSAALAVEAGDTAPAFQGTDLAGRDVIFPHTATGQTSVLVFWATWCNYCRALMPYLATMQVEYAEDKVRILAINAKEDGDPRAYMKINGYTFSTILNGDAIAEAYGVEYIPGLFVVNADGMVIYRRGWTDLPAGQEVAELWDAQVRRALNAASE